MYDVLIEPNPLLAMFGTRPENFIFNLSPIGDMFHSSTLENLTPPTHVRWVKEAMYYIIDLKRLNSLSEVQKWNFFGNVVTFPSILWWFTVLWVRDYLNRFCFRLYVILLQHAPLHLFPNNLLFLCDLTFYIRHYLGQMGRLRQI